MIRQTYSQSLDGFHGAYYPNPQGSRTGMVLVLGNSRDNGMILSCVRWLHSRGCSVMAVAPGTEGWHSFPLESIGAALEALKQRGNDRLGILGASITGSLALLAASVYPDIRMTVALAPSDFVPEGFLRDGLDGAGERPADGESMVTLGGKPLPFLPYAWRHPLYWQNVRAESRSTGNLIASRSLFVESERLHPLREEERIPVERIRGTLILCGAEDDCLWDACGYIRRIHERLREKGGRCRALSLLYRHGTHFLAPQSLVSRTLHLATPLLPAVFHAGRKYPLECRQSRIDLDQRLTRELERWQKEATP